MKSVPKILFINNTSQMGSGTSRSLLLLIRQLRRDFDILVASDRASSELPLALSQFNIRHFALQDRTLLYLPQLIQLILKEKINLVYANNFSGRARVAFWASRLTLRPFIWHVRESFRSNTSGSQVRNAQAVIANSQDTARRLREYAHVPDVLVIPNGVDPADFLVNTVDSRKKFRAELGCETDSLVVVNLGRIGEQKNQLAALGVARKVQQEGILVHFVFVGDFQDQEYARRLQAEAKTMPLPALIHFTGYREDFIACLFGSDILLHTACREPQGRAILEAMATRLPVVAFDVGGIGEAVISGETGFLRPLNDTAGLTEDLKKLLGDPILRSTMGQAGYERVRKNFSAVNSALQVRDVIEHVLGI